MFDKIIFKILNDHFDGWINGDNTDGKEADGWKSYLWPYLESGNPGQVEVTRVLTVSQEKMTTYRRASIMKRIYFINLTFCCFVVCF